MRLGIVGAGVIAARYAERIAEVDGLELVAVTDVVPERARALAEQHGATAHASLHFPAEQTLLLATSQVSTT